MLDARRDLLFGVVLAFAAAGCADSRRPNNAQAIAPDRAEREANGGPEDEPTRPSATIVVPLVAAAGADAHGTVTFTETTEGVTITAELEGLSPGEHGFHVHQSGDCSDAGFKAAGDHFNPTEAPHGGPDDAHRHLGDLGNVLAGHDGRARHVVTLPDLTLQPGEVGSILGRSIILHADADDLVSQPAGNSGDRIACGVIEETIPRPRA